MDEIVVFHALDRAQLRQIVDIQLARLRQLLKDRQITIELTDKAKDFVVAEGYDPAFGARPLKRVIQHKIADPLATDILLGKVESGDHVLVDAIGEELTFTVLETQAA